MHYFKVEDLKDYAVRYFTRWGITPEDALTAAQVLLSADMRGVDSHGLIRLHSYYGSRLAKGQIDPHAPLTVTRETVASLAVDANNDTRQA